jgi:hypothetical protein
MYGTTAGGGNYDCLSGTVFELAPSGTGCRESILYSLSGGINGSAPVSALLLDSRGNLYGPASTGGADGRGNRV